METYLQWHQKKYPLMNKEDEQKLQFQSLYGTAHLVANADESLNRMIEESTNQQYGDEDLYEYISDDYLRVHLRAYLANNLSFDLLNSWFIQSISKEDFSSEHTSHFNLIPSHSTVYKKAYLPSYRLIQKRFLTDEMRFIQAKSFITRLTTPAIISLEGKCAAGKTTIANKLKEQINLSILPVDDFFLPSEKKTSQRIQEPGGNIDYERLEQVLSSVQFNQNLTYLKFNCTTQAYEEKTIYVTSILLLEGVYSYHPSFRSYIDYLMFLYVDDLTQNKRLQERDHYKRFIDEWVPLEDAYFEKEQIFFKADIII